MTTYTDFSNVEPPSHHCMVKLGKPAAKRPRQVVRIKNPPDGRGYWLEYGNFTIRVHPGMWVKVHALARKWMSHSWGWL